MGKSINFILSEIIIKNSYFKFLFFFLLFLVGLYIYNDYGVSLDEDAFITNGKIEYEYLKNIIFNYNPEYEYKNFFIEVGKFSNLYYLIVLLISDILSVNLYTVSHLFLYFFFLFSCFIFFNILNEKIKDDLLSYLAILIIFSSPRIFSEAFYNARDLFFFSWVILFIFFFNKVIAKIDLKNIIFFSAISAICIHLRIFGLILFLTSIIFIILEFEDVLKKKILIIKILILITLTFLFLYIVTPIYWLDPFSNFFKFYFSDLTVSSNIRVTNIFLNNLYSSQFTPWYYHITWILFTIPFFYIFLILIAYFKRIFFFSRRLVNLKDNNNIWNNKDELFIFYIILNLTIFIFIFSRFSSVRYDGWRHLYFLYPFMVLLLFFFLHELKSSFLKIYKITISVLIINLILNINWIIKNHPYQFVYFNFLQNFIYPKKFDLDYWGVSNYQIYKYLIKNETKNNITVGTLSFNDLLDNYNALSNNEQTRITLVSKYEKPDYLIDNYRIGYKRLKFTDSEKRKLLQNYNSYFQIVIDGNIVTSVYKKQ